MGKVRLDAFVEVPTYIEGGSQNLVQNQNVEKAYDEDEYRRIVNLFARIIDGLKGHELEDSRLVDGEPLANKVFLHAATAFYLSKGTNVELLLGHPGIFFDFSSVEVLARTALETYLTFHHVFVAPQSPDEFDFRHSAWQLSGLAQRQRFPATLSEHQARLEQERQQIEQLRDRIQQTTAFKQLPQRETSKVLKGKNWRPQWRAIARLAGINEAFFDFLYGFQSSYAHADSLAALQIGQAGRAPDDQRGLVEAPLLSIMLTVAKMIEAYTRRFPAVEAILDSDPDTARLVQIYVGIFANNVFNV